MSGLFAYLGKKRALPVIMQGLRLMKDFSYDSCGMILKSSEKFYTKKIIGSIYDIEKQVIDYSGEELTGAVHLRWATHGEVTEKNIHPFLSCDNKIAVLHKGIVTNYKVLRQQLISEGHVFNSDTDSEVLVHLIEKNYSGDLSAAVRKALLNIEGTYGLVVYYLDGQVEMVVANAGMDMLLGIGDKEYWVALDENILYPFTDKVVFLNDGEMAKINQDGFVGSLIAGGNINVVKKPIEKIDQSKSDFGQRFTDIEREILEQPDVVRNSLAGRIDEKKFTAHFGGLDEYKEILRTTSRIVFVGSGSSYYAALMAREFIEDYAAIAVSVYSSLEFRYKRFVLPSEKTVLFVISQSGSTEDTVAALREAKQLGITVFGITNTVGSVIARESNSGIFLHSGPTFGMPIQSFMSQISALVLLTVHLGRLRGLSPVSGMEILNALNAVPVLLKTIIESSYLYKNIVKKYLNYKKYYIFGSKYAYPVALEGSLLLSSITGMTVSGANVAELEYGLLEQIGKDSLVLFLLPRDSLYERNIGVLKTVKSRGAKVIVITFEGEENLSSLADEVVMLPKSKDILTPLLMLMALQMWIYYLVKEKIVLAKEEKINNNIYSEYDYFA